MKEEGESLRTQEEARIGNKGIRDQGAASGDPNERIVAGGDCWCRLLESPYSNGGIGSFGICGIR